MQLNIGKEHDENAQSPKLPCQNVLGASIFAAFSQFLAAYSTLDFISSSLAGKGTWCLLPTTPSMRPTATKHFDRIAENEPFIENCG